MPNRRDLPREVLDVSGREVNSSMFAFAPPVTVVSYVPKAKKNVLLVSTMHDDDAVDEENVNRKPEIILFYNDTKAGVDAIDQMCRHYTAKIASRRWPLVVFFNMLDVAAVNALTIYEKCNPAFRRQYRSSTRRQFLRELSCSLVANVAYTRKIDKLKVRVQIN